MDVVLLFVALAVILLGAELFTNGIEWFGHRLNLAEGAVGSVLAAVAAFARQGERRYAAVSAIVLGLLVIGITAAAILTPTAGG